MGEILSSFMFSACSLFSNVEIPIFVKLHGMSLLSETFWRIAL